MRIVCTMPGKHGDILWSLPTVRAVSETYGTPVDLLISTKYNSHAQLLQLQPYIRSVISWPDWQLTNHGRSPWSPFDCTLHRMPIGLPTYDAVFHLGYPSVPDEPLPHFIYRQLKRTLPEVHFSPLDLSRPWITTLTDFSEGGESTIAVGWSGEQAKWKRSLTIALRARFRDVTFVPVMPDIGKEDAWTRNWCFNVPRAANWVRAAERIAASRSFIGCCSALHVLACATGKFALIVEPAESRWNPVFYPFGTEGSRVRLVRSTDAGLSSNAETVVDVIEPILSRLISAPCS